MLGSDSDTAFSPGNLTIYGGEPDLDHPDQFTIEWRFNDYHGTAVGRVGYGPPEFGNSFLTVDIEGLP